MDEHSAHRVKSRQYSAWAIAHRLDQGAPPMSTKCDGRLTASEHPASCSHFIIRCSECGRIGATEFLNELPPCPKEQPAVRR